MSKNSYLLFIIAAAVIGGLVLLKVEDKQVGRLDDFAECLADKGIAMYGADWCSDCQSEKEVFGDSFRLIPYIECSEDPERCLAADIVGFPTWVFPDGKKLEGEQGLEKLSTESGCSLPSEGVVLPVRWGDLGVKMASAGVIDREKLESLYAGRGGFSGDSRKLLEETQNGQLKITAGNSGFLLNILWALGLGTKNDILEKGGMNDPQYGGAANFASTGGWTLAEGGAMNHYSRHPFIVLTLEQQKLVERVSKNVYRPCCDNPAHFPDCNHGMAMLGLLELMAAQGVSEPEMYKTALQVNSYWFSDAYLIIAQYLASKGIDWDDVDPKEILGVNYSSSSGYRQVLSQVTASAQKSDGGCGV